MPQSTDRHGVIQINGCDDLIFLIFAKSPLTRSIQTYEVGALVPNVERLLPDGVRMTVYPELDAPFRFRARPITRGRAVDLLLNQGLHSSVMILIDFAQPPYPCSRVS